MPLPYQWNNIKNKRWNFVYNFISVCFLIIGIGIGIAFIRLIAVLPAFASMSLGLMSLIFILGCFIFGSFGEHKKLLDKFEGLEKKLNAKR